jgi:hypothetical protein
MVYPACIQQDIQLEGTTFNRQNKQTGNKFYVVI